MRYYSTQRPITPGSYPARAKVKEIKNFDKRIFCEEIGRVAWGYLETDGSLTKEDLEAYELVEAGEIVWYGVTVCSKKHGGGLKAIVNSDIVRAVQCPQDRHWETKVREFKCRYFKSREEAERVRDVLNSIEITTERVRGSATQGECKLYLNGTYILHLGDDIVHYPEDTDPMYYYGENICGWASMIPDSRMVLRFVWHPYMKRYVKDTALRNKNE